MDKKQFLTIAERLYNEMFPEQAEGNLFESEEAPKEKEIGPFKMRKEATRISTIAEHYKQATGVIAGVCQELGIKPIKGVKGGSMIRKDDVDFLVMYIGRRYYNFNER